MSFEPPGKPSEAGREARKSSPPGFTGKPALPTTDFRIFKNPEPSDNTFLLFEATLFVARAQETNMNVETEAVSRVGSPGNLN